MSAPEMKAPGPGRDFDGCPDFCGLIALVTLAFGVGWYATMRYIGKRTKQRG